MVGSAKAGRSVRGVVARILACAACSGGAPVAVAGPPEPAADATERGWQFGATYTGEYFHNVRGGLERGGAYLDNLDLTLEFDGGRSLGVEGLSAYVHALYNNGGSFSGRYAGDTHVASNIEAVRALRLYEAWFDYRFGSRSDRSLRLGLYDLNSEFDASEVGSLFINSTYGIGVDFAQAGLNGPSIFPYTSLALRARWDVAPGWTLQAAVLDGVPQDPDDPQATAVKLGDGDGALWVGEVAHASDTRRIVLGHWRFTTEFDDLFATDPAGGPLRRKGSHGSYGFVEGRLWAAAGGGQRLDGVLRLGHASPDVNPIQRTAQFALVLHEPFAGGAADSLGIAVATYRNGRPFLAAAASAGTLLQRRETNLELTYRIEINDWLTLQPDVQWAMNPGTDPALRDAWILGLRFEVRGTSH